MAARHVGDLGSYGRLEPALCHHAQLLADSTIPGGAPGDRAQEQPKHSVIRPPDLTLLRRVAWGLAGVLWFFWIAYEDRGLEALTYVALVIASAAGLTVLNRWVGDEKLPRRKWLLRTGAVGLGAGASVSPLTALLMLVKLGLHAHPELDFGPEQFIQALSRTIYWAALGAMIGLAFGLFVRESRV